MYIVYLEAKKHACNYRMSKLPLNLNEEEVSKLWISSVYHSLQSAPLLCKNIDIYGEKHLLHSLAEADNFKIIIT